MSLGIDDTGVTALAARLGRSLAAEGRMIATVESCTGGLIAQALTETPGSSQWFDRGFVTYTNEAKTELVGVPASLIAGHGAVSEPVASAMAEGALARSRAWIALSVTGIAGPGGGSPAKPVGTVCFGWALPDEPVRVLTRRFEGDRSSVRRQAAAFALEEALRLLRMARPASAGQLSGSPGDRSGEGA
jgi:nicotinamide-nucleotide amidase